MDHLWIVTWKPPYIQATIRAFLDRNPGRKPLIILDTLGKARSEYFGRDVYQREYREAGELHALLEDHPGSSLCVVHHNNKADRSDFVEQVSGSNGLAGSADTIVVIQRPRHSNNAKLHVTGREVQEGVYALRMDEGYWVLDGDSLDSAAERARLELAFSDLSPDMAAVAQVLSEFESGVSLKVATGRLPHIPYNTLVKYASRLVEDGYLEKPSRGMYVAGPKLSLSKENGEEDKVTEVTSHEPEELNSKHGSVTSVTLSPSEGSTEGLP